MLEQDIYLTDKEWNANKSYNVYRVTTTTLLHFTLLTPLTSTNLSSVLKLKSNINLHMLWNISTYILLFQCDSFSGNYQGYRLQDHGARAGG